ncbi:MAG: hypothetical protein AB7O66_18795 [Limisphaerales bacterium]
MFEADEIHHEGTKNTKAADTTHGQSVVYRFDRTPEWLSSRSFVAFVNFVVSLGEDLGRAQRLAATPSALHRPTMPADAAEAPAFVEALPTGMRRVA